jgi:hypothetical protein
VSVEKLIESIEPDFLEKGQAVPFRPKMIDVGKVVHVLLVGVMLKLSANLCAVDLIARVGSHWGISHPGRLGDAINEPLDHLGFGQR